MAEFGSLDLVAGQPPREASWPLHTADHTPSFYAYGDKTCPANIDSASLIRWFTIVRPQTLRLAYNQAGGDYVAYADGDPMNLFEFDGPHAYADRRVWTLLDAKLTDLRASGTRSIRVVQGGLRYKLRIRGTRESSLARGTLPTNFASIILTADHRCRARSTRRK